MCGGVRLENLLERRINNFSYCVLVVYISNGVKIGPLRAL